MKWILLAHDNHCYSGKTELHQFWINDKNVKVCSRHQPYRNAVCVGELQSIHTLFARDISNNTTVCFAIAEQGKLYAWGQYIDTTKTTKNTPIHQVGSSARSVTVLRLSEKSSKDLGLVLCVLYKCFPRNYIQFYNLNLSALKNMKEPFFYKKKWRYSWSVTSISLYFFDDKEYLMFHRKDQIPIVYEVDSVQTQLKAITRFESKKVEENACRTYKKEIKIVAGFNFLLCIDQFGYLFRLKIIHSLSGRNYSRDQIKETAGFKFKRVDTIYSDKSKDIFVALSTNNKPYTITFDHKTGIKHTCDNVPSIDSDYFLFRDYSSCESGFGKPVLITRGQDGLRLLKFSVRENVWKDDINLFGRSFLDNNLFKRHKDIIFFDNVGYMLTEKGVLVRLTDAPAKRILMNVESISPGIGGIVAHQNNLHSYRITSSCPPMYTNNFGCKCHTVAGRREIWTDSSGKLFFVDERGNIAYANTCIGLIEDVYFSYIFAVITAKEYLLINFGINRMDFFSYRRKENIICPESLTPIDRYIFYTNTKPFIEDPDLTDRITFLRQQQNEAPGGSLQINIQPEYGRKKFSVHKIFLE